MLWNLGGVPLLAQGSTMCPHLCTHCDSGIIKGTARAQVLSRERVALNKLRVSCPPAPPPPGDTPVGRAGCVGPWAPGGRDPWGLSGLPPRLPLPCRELPTSRVELRGPTCSPRVTTGRGRCQREEGANEPVREGGRGNIPTWAAKLPYATCVRGKGQRFEVRGCSTVTMRST